MAAAHARHHSPYGKEWSIAQFVDAMARTLAKGENVMIKLSFWEQFIVSAAVSFLSVLALQTTNPTALAGIDGAQTFLQDLLNGKVATS